jgi:hypothetical protein
MLLSFWHLGSFLGAQTLIRNGSVLVRQVTPSSGFIIVLTTPVEGSIEQAKFEFAPGELSTDLIETLSVLKFSEIKTPNQHSPDPTPASGAAH